MFNRRPSFLRMKLLNVAFVMFIVVVLVDFSVRAFGEQDAVESVVLDNHPAMHKVFQMEQNHLHINPRAQCHHIGVNHHGAIPRQEICVDLGVNPIQLAVENILDLFGQSPLCLLHAVFIGDKFDGTPTAAAFNLR